MSAPSRNWAKAFTVGTRYWILHQSDEQRYPRLSVMTFLDPGDAERGVWNARPAAGTQQLPWSWILDAEPAAKDEAHFVNRDGRGAVIPKAPTVTADDILTTEASRALAESTAMTIRDALVKQSGRRFGVPVVWGAGEQDVVAMVEVLGEFAYVVAVAGEADLAELAQDFPAIAYLTEQSEGTS